MGKKLMGVAEVADALSVGRQRASQLADSPRFPNPYDRIAAGPVWLTKDVDRWLAINRPEESGAKGTAMEG